jgi:peptidyl-prolyl cis-trans isomerase A (cyclophilin A)
MIHPQRSRAYMIRSFTALAMALVASATLGAEPASPQAPAAQSPAPTHTRVRVTTSVGIMVFELEDERAPLTVANFLKYVRAGQYNGTIFHRVIANFVIQGGGYLPDFSKRPTRDAIPNESGNGLRNTRGTIGMARTDEPHSAHAQFFVNLADNPDLDPLPTRWGYAVFGHIIQGVDVLDRIGNVATGAAGELKEDVPVKPVIIQKIEIVPGPSP